jgi:hypothetical protein
MENIPQNILHEVRGHAFWEASKFIISVVVAFGYRVVGSIRETGHDRYEELYILLITFLLLTLAHYFIGAKDGTGLKLNKNTAVIVLAVLVFIGYIAYLFKPSESEQVDGRTFANEVVVLDGHDFVNCTFTNVTFVYDGKTPVKFTHNTVVGGFRFKTNNEVVDRTAVLMRGLGLTRPEIPLMGLDDKPLEHIQPPTFHEGTPTPSRQQ